MYTLNRLSAGRSVSRENLLVSPANQVPMDVKPPATVDECAYLEAGVPPTKEVYTSPSSDPLCRQSTIVATPGAVVGGVVGSRNRTSGNGTGPPTPVILSPWVPLTVFKHRV